jgi:hypothetical protein
MAKENPAHVRMEKAFGNRIRILVVINQSMMSAMVSRPPQRRILESRRAEKEGEQAHRPTGFEAQMRKKPMVTQRDAQASSRKKEKEQDQLEGTQARIPEIRRRRGHAQEQSPGEERAITPTDFRPWKSRNKMMHLIFGIRSGKKSRPFPTIGYLDLHCTDVTCGTIYRA